MCGKKAAAELQQSADRVRSEHSALLKAVHSLASSLEQQTQACATLPSLLSNFGKRDEVELAKSLESFDSLTGPFYAVWEAFQTASKAFYKDSSSVKMLDALSRGALGEEC